MRKTKVKEQLGQWLIAVQKTTAAMFTFSLVPIWVLIIIVMSSGPIQCVYTDSWDLLSLLLVENPTGRIPIRHQGVSINVTKDSESANVTVKLKVKLLLMS